MGLSDSKTGIRVEAPEATFPSVDGPDFLQGGQTDRRPNRTTDEARSRHNAFRVQLCLIHLT